MKNYIELIKSLHEHEAYKNGITLISLVITIVLIIILVTVGINLSLGQNGLFERAKNAKKHVEIEIIKEQILMDILDKQVESEGNILVDDSLEEILLMYGTLSKETNVRDKTLTTTKGNYEIKVSDILDKKIEYERVKIESFTITNSTLSTIIVEVSASLAEEYEFYIGESKTDYQKVDTIEAVQEGDNVTEIVTYKYEIQETLQDEKTYYLKVIAKNKNEQDVKETTVNIGYKEAMTGSVNGYSSSNSTYAYGYFPLTVANNEMDEYFTYENNVITFKKDCIIKFEGDIQTTTSDTGTVLVYYLNEDISNNHNPNCVIKSTGTNTLKHTFNTSLNVHTNDYIIVKWKPMHYNTGIASSSHQAKINLKIKIF